MSEWRKWRNRLAVVAYASPMVVLICWCFWQMGANNACRSLYGRQDTFWNTSAGGGCVVGIFDTQPLPAPTPGQETRP